MCSGILKRSENLQDVGEVESALVGNAVGDREEVGVTERHANEFSLSTSKTSCEVRISKDATDPVSRLREVSDEHDKAE
jgi:hypothetical protein